MYVLFLNVDHAGFVPNQEGGGEAVEDTLAASAASPTLQKSLVDEQIWRY